MAGSQRDFCSGESGRRLHYAWQVGVVVTVTSGLFHLINTAAPGRSVFGPLFVTPFRLAFIISWALLAAGYIARRRWPRLDLVDTLVAAAVAVFLLRGVFVPETLGITVNWIITGAGVFYLIKHGAQDKRDVRLITISLAAAVVVIALAGIAEYIFKENPLFDAIEVDVIGADARVEASRQFYRIRSLIGHPGFVGAVLLGGAPLVMLVLWRRRLLLGGALLGMTVALFLSFSRGSWLLTLLFFAPVLLYYGRHWLKRNVKWLGVIATVLVLFVAVDYVKREEVSARLVNQPAEEGLYLTKAEDGSYVAVRGEAEGAQPSDHFLYFDVDDAFYRADHGAVTVVVHYFDRGWGAIRLEYDSWDEEAGVMQGAFTPSAGVSKTDSGRWTTAAFFLENPRFDGRQNKGADFRIVDDDNLVVIDKVVLQKGKLKLPTVISLQWSSRAGSFATRMSLYPFAWSVLKEHPLGVGLFNSPGTNHHAVDSLPLTWIMEFGWLALPTLGLLGWVAFREGLHVFRARSGPAAVLYLSLMLLLVHGGHLMILYDKPSLVLFSAVGALYTLVRPWGLGGPLFDVSSEDCIL